MLSMEPMVGLAMAPMDMESVTLRLNQSLMLSMEPMAGMAMDLDTVLTPWDMDMDMAMGMDMDIMVLDTTFILWDMVMDILVMAMDMVLAMVPMDMESVRRRLNQSLMLSMEPMAGMVMDLDTVLTL